MRGQARGAGVMAGVTGATEAPTSRWASVARGAGVFAVDGLTSAVELSQHSLVAHDLVRAGQLVLDDIKLGRRRGDTGGI
jgi:hypothetical protein